MPRMPFVAPEDISASERPAYDAFLQKRGNLLNAGPYALLLHMPELAQRLESLRLPLCPGRGVDGMTNGTGSGILQ